MKIEGRIWKEQAKQAISKVFGPGCLREAKPRTAVGAVTEINVRTGRHKASNSGSFHEDWTAESGGLAV